MAVRIITDSACDLELSKRAEWNIDILVLRVFFGEDAYVEGENMTRPEFYDRLRAAEELPKTAQITPMEFEDVMRPYVEAGDEIVVLPLSKELSGTYSSAVIAQQVFPDAEIFVVDTLNVTFGLAALVAEAVRLRDGGYRAAEIAKRIQALSTRVRLCAVVDDLKYLKMGGRLSSAGAVVGSLLGIKPIVAIQEGKVVCVHKTRGLKAGFEYVAEQLSSADVDESMPVWFGHSDAPERMEELIHCANKKKTLPDIRRCDIGPVVGTHAGPGCTGVVYFIKES